MTTRVMVTLQDDVYRHVERLAQLTSRDVADLLADTITLALQPLAVSAESVPAITSLSDEEVLGLTEFQMVPEQDRRLSALLQPQRAENGDSTRSRAPGISSVARGQPAGAIHLRQPGTARNGIRKPRCCRRLLCGIVDTGSPSRGRADEPVGARTWIARLRIIAKLRTRTGRRTAPGR